MICGIILAAGASRRMGQPKMEMRMGAKPLLLWTVDAALGSTLDRVFCVIRPELDRDLVRELEQRKLQLLVNPTADLGQSTSLKEGLYHLPNNCRAALFLLGDQPFVPTRLIDEILRVYRETSAILVAPEVHGEVRNPILFDRSLFSELRMVSGDQGGRDVIRRHTSEIVKIPIDDPMFNRDVDTPEDFQELNRWVESQK
jgi:molybdenum cofactor cytidylyltransferase